jgi:hypothetical protein
MAAGGASWPSMASASMEGVMGGRNGGIEAPLRRGGERMTRVSLGFRARVVWPSGPGVGSWQGRARRRQSGFMGAGLVAS